MSAQPIDRLERRRMSFEDYLELPDDVRAEFVNGEVVVTPPARLGHNEAGARLLVLLRESLPGLCVGYEVGVRIADGRYRIPDLAVMEPPFDFDAVWQERPPMVVVEIASPGTWVEDVVRKSAEYLAAGVSQYWLVERDKCTLTIMRAEQGDDRQQWETELVLDADNPTGEVQVGDHGTVPLDLAAIMPE